VVSTSNLQIHIVEEKDAAKRLDVFLAEVTGITRSQIQKAITEGLVKIDERVVSKANYRLKPGQKIVFVPPIPQESELNPEAIPLDILYEDKHLIVVNKAAGMVVHPAPGHEQGTLVHALLHHCQDLSGIGGVKRPGIVHRLDKDTSGVLLVAKNDVAHLELSRQFKERLIEKEYLCLVLGVPEKGKGVIDFPIGRHPTDRKKFSIHTQKPRDALTLWELKEAFSYCSLLLCQPKTGRTHQIRVHLTAIGHPILGDPLYLRKSRLSKIPDKAMRALLKQTPRLMLHAWRVRFTHPISGERMEFVAPLPEDMTVFIEKIKEVTRA